MQIKRVQKKAMAMLALVPFAWMTACGGGGGDGSSGTGSTSANENLPATTQAAITSVPLAGEVVADCSNTGVGVVDSIIDATSGIATSTLPVAIPKLSDVIALADLATLPVIGGQLADSGGLLETISAEEVLALLPAGVPGLADLPLTGQLPTVCSSLVGSLPPLAISDPEALLALLGDPTSALGLIPIFDSSNNPVGVLLATLPSGLLPDSGLLLPGVSTVPNLVSLVPVDSGTLPVVGPTLTSITGNLLGLLDTNTLLSGGLLSLLSGLLP